ncbi:dynein heavy chain domain-containing protein 1-like isoform X2 [Anneissia japonica]|uniref:dynein heavy chain domain-containing protein 1-like isoform X2 n=1 Tax=Anneissia japonica TaxID=1529436 RepID=UPI0014258169|nr:dynein heavy chain domain-containing protein 1-like isoform X2 [Anneissia japonica]
MSATKEHTRVGLVVVPSLELRNRETNTLSTPGQYVMPPGDKALAWSLETRHRLDDFVNRGEEATDLVNNLSQELISVFIATLQQDSYYQWMYLKEVLILSKPYADYLQGNTQITHYIDRICFYLQNQKHRLGDLQLEDVLASIFPKETERAEKSGGDSRNYSKPTPPSAPKASTPRKPIVSMLLPNGSDPYELAEENVPDGISPRGLCFGDLKEALPKVVIETTQREAIWSEGLGLTAAALNIDLPEKLSETTVEQESGETVDSVESTPAEPDIPQVEHSENAGREPVLSPPMTGKEAVEMFGKGRHLGKASFIYLNKARTRHFRPYDLVVVPKHKANPDEHWIISCFGIMHKVRGQPAESLELFDWHREAVLWSTITKIPFFKYFITRKVFLRWRANRRYKDFCKTHQHIASILLKASPSFGSALLHVSRLVQELHTVEFLPFDKSRCYTLVEFDQITRTKKRAGELLLEKFFEYCKLVVDTTCNDLIAKLNFCEAQTKSDKLIFSKDSLHVQRLKKEQREKNLKDAQDEAKYLGNFVKLVDQMLLTHLLALARANICTFVNNTMVEGQKADRKALYAAKLVFNESSCLSLFPSKEKFSNTVTSALQAVAQVMWEKAKSMEDGSLADQGKNMDATSGTNEDSQHRPSLTLNVSSASPVTPVSLSREGKDEPMVLPDEDDTSTQLTEPVMSVREDPTKDLDVMGVLTPELVPRANHGTSIKIEGHGFIGQYSALNKVNLQEKLSQDVEMQASYKMYFKYINDAMKDIDSFCTEHHWLTEIHKFTQSWTKDSVKAWHKAQAYTIETQLSQIRTWVERVKNVDRFFTSENQLFYIDCGVIQETLVPALNGAFRDLLNFTAEEAKKFSSAFISEVQEVVLGMKSKETTTEGFAEYAQRYGIYKLKMGTLQQEVEYVKSLFEVIRLSYRSLTPEEEKIEERVWHNWEAFLLQLQEAAEFVNTQLPLKQIQLQESFQKLEEEVERILKDATTGPFLDPSQNPTKLLAVGQKLFDEFYVVAREMRKCSKYKEMITGQAFDTSRLDFALHQITVRWELWKYIEVSSYTIQDWMRQLFRRMNVQKAIDKVDLWQTAAKRFLEELPSDDKVLLHWFKLLSDFKQDLPLLLKLSSDSLKPRHWKALFVSLGQPYHAGQHFSVAELLSFNLSEHSLQVNTICNGAIAEFTLETKLKQIRKVWDEKEFKLAKHIPEKMYNSQHNQAKQPSWSIIKTEVDMYTLIGIEELKYLLEDSQVTLQCMLVSPHLAELKTEAEIWHHNLQQVDEMLDLWTLTQIKWRYLSKVFSSDKLSSTLHKQAVKFNSVNTRYEEIMKSVVGDPKVLSILNKRVGQKNRRPLQGDVLRDCFKSMIHDQEEIIKELQQHLKEIRSKFPRLYFMSDDDLMILLTITRDKRAWVPYARNLFPGITELKFAVPNSSAMMKTMLDMHLHSHKLEVIGIYGDHGESVPLIAAVASTSEISDWLGRLEANVKSTMGNFLQMCMEARLSRDYITPVKILEELASLEETKKEKKQSEEESKLKHAVKRNFQHWLLRFPAQCVLTAEAVVWERNTRHALEDQDKSALLKNKESLDRRLEQYISILSEISAGDLNFDPRNRLHILLRNLINQTLHQKCIIEGLLSVSSISSRCFEWESVLKHRMNWQSVLCARPSLQPTEGAFQLLADPESEPSLNARAPTVVTSSFVFGDCSVQQMGKVFNYDHEYFGPSLRAVCTLLTDRCHLGLTMAMSRFQCGTAIGPTASGKTELIQDLSQTMGRHLFSLTCCHDNSMDHIIGVLTGAIQSGSWFLIDDADLLPQGLQSVLGQQLNYVLDAYKALSSTYGSQYDMRGTSKFDKSKDVRRNSLTTLHSSSELIKPKMPKGSTCPKIITKIGKRVKFEKKESSKDEEEVLPHLQLRRHSISKTMLIDDGQHYENASNAIPLFEDTASDIDEAGNDNKETSTIEEKFNQLLKWKYKPTYLGHLTLGGQLVEANANFACFMNVSTTRQTNHDMPQNLRVLMRPVSMIKPDIGVILEATLICNGFTEAKTLAHKITTLMDLLDNQLPQIPQYKVNLSTLKTALKLAASRLHARRNTQLSARNSFSRAGDASVASPLTDSLLESMEYIEQDEEQKQELALVHGLTACLIPRLTSVQDIRMVKNLLRSVFPRSSRPSTAKEHDPVLMDAVQSQFVLDKLQATPQHVSKVLELHKNLESSIGTILLGPAGSGKTVCYQTLARALNKLHTDFASNTQGANSGDKRNEGKISPELQRSSTMDRILRKGEVLSSQAGRVCYNPVNVDVLYPSVLSTEQMFGTYDVEVQCWKDGVFTKLLRDRSITCERAKVLTSKENKEQKKLKGMLNPPSIINSWVVMDGSIDPMWSDNLNAILRKSGTINLGHGVSINRSDSTSIIFETTDISTASPATVTRCSVVHFGMDVVQWRSIIESWLGIAKSQWELSNDCLQLLKTHVADLFSLTIDFVTEQCTPALMASLTSEIKRNNQIGRGVQEVTSFIRIMSALCDRFILNEEDVPTPRSGSSEGKPPTPTSGTSSDVTVVKPTQVRQISTLFVFAFIWGFGGHLHDRYAEKFDVFFKNLISKTTHDIQVPSSGSVFCWYIDPNQAVLVSAVDQLGEKIKTLPSNYTIIPEINRYFNLIDLLVSSNYHILLTGEPGCGKTSLMQNLVQPRHYFVKATFSQQLTCEQVEEFMLSKLRTRNQVNSSKNTGKSNKQSNIIFIDDLNCCPDNKPTGSQPCIELVRQFINCQGVYHRSRNFFQAMERANFIAACNAPGSAGVGSGLCTKVLSPRITRLFTVLNFFALSHESYSKLHCSTMQAWLEEFPAYSLNRHHELAQAILLASQDLFKSIRKHFSLSPLNPHYTFSLHDISRVVQGMFLLSPRARGRPRHGHRRTVAGTKGGNYGRRRSRGEILSAPPMMKMVIRLWCHETTRTFSDRLVTEEAFDWYTQSLQQVVEKHFCTGETDTTSGNISEDVQLADILSPTLSEGSVVIGQSPDSVCKSVEPEEDDDEDNVLSKSTSTPGTGTTRTASSISDATDQITSDESSMSPGTTLSSATPLEQDDTGTSVTSQMVDSRDTPVKEHSHEPDMPTTSQISSSAIHYDSQLSEGRCTEVGMSDSKNTAVTVSDILPETNETSQPDVAKGIPSESAPPPSAIGVNGSVPHTPIRKSLQKSPARGLSKEKKRGVTFKPGLIGDTFTFEQYKGPLISMDEICSSEEKLSDILFTKFISTDLRDSDKAAGYGEVNTNQIHTGLQKCLNLYNEGADQQMDLVFFEEALRHFAKLTRVLGTQGGNALLIGQTRGTGRSSLTRLAASAAKFKMFEPKPSSVTKDRSIRIREAMRRASRVAGLAGKPAVLLVSCEPSDQSLYDLTALMKEGTCPGLYSKEDLDQIALQMLPGSKPSGHRSQRVEMAQERFFRRVLVNLHVVVSLHCPGGDISSLHECFCHHPSLLHSSCCVDIYKPWSHESLISIASQCLNRKTLSMKSRKAYMVPWSCKNVQAEMNCISHAMACIHRTSINAIDRHFHKSNRFYSPLTFIEFIDLFKTISARLGKKYTNAIIKYKKALGSINEAYESISSLNIELQRLQPLHADAMLVSQQRLTEVDKLKNEYADAKEQCRLDEIAILKMEGPLEQMKKEAQDELDKVNPIYEAALKALKSLNSHDLDEIRSYRAPPVAVVNVVSALCLLFQEPYDWASGKLLINRDNFFEDLEFYEKDRMPDDVFYKLNIMFIQDTSFRPEVVAVVSKAAESLCKWVHAVYAYACLHRALHPKLKQVQIAEAKLDQAKAHLGLKRVKCQEVKVILEEQIQIYQDSVKSVNDIEVSMKSTEEKINSATHLMINMSMQHATWKSALAQSEKHLATAPGDALLAAACVCYHGPMDQLTREEMITDWLLRCKTGRYHPKQTTQEKSGQETSVTEQITQANNVCDRKHIESTVSGRETADGFTSISGDDMSLPPFLSRESTDESFSHGSSQSRATILQPCHIRENFSLDAILSDQEEQRSWQNQEIPQDKYAFHNLLIMRTCCQWGRRHWPLLLDPDQQVETWVQLINNSSKKVLQDNDEEDALFEESVTPVLTSKALEALEQVSEYSTGQSTGFLESSIGETTETEYPQTPATGMSIGGDTPRHPNYDGSDGVLETTSFTDQSEPSSVLLLDPDMERPQGDIWIISSDDSSVEMKLIQSVVLGLTMLIKNLERKPLDPRFDNVMKRNFVLGLDGKRRLKIGSLEYVCHPSFNLYLSSSVPLHLKGANIFPQPTELTSVINLAISPEGLSNQILEIAISFERPEYDNQVKTLEGDIRDQKLFMEKVEMDILMNTINLEVGILEESTMLDQLLKYQQNIQSTEASLHESLLYLDQIKSKTKDYKAVSEHATLLYQVVDSMSQLNPLYYQSLGSFVHLCRSVIKGHRKESGILLDPKARATELVNALTHEVHEHISHGVSELHSDIFIFLVSVAKLKSCNEVSEIEWSLFLNEEAVFVTEVPEADNKPSWIPKTAWTSCSRLEKFVPCFQGLTSSFTNQSRQWYEYFACEPNLLSIVPGEIEDRSLTAFQKILLWKVMKPDVTRQLCHCLAVHQLASTIAKTTGYHIGDVLPQTSSNKPTIFILPSPYGAYPDSANSGHSLFDPVSEVLQEAKHTFHNRVIHVVSMGMPSQLLQAEKLLNDCQVKGHWLVLSNCHLVEHWNNRLIDLLKSALGAHIEQMHESNPQTLHPGFRLWITTAADSSNPLPAIITQHGVKVFCQTTSNFKSSLMYHFNSVMKDAHTMPAMLKPSVDVKVLNELIFSTSLLHAVLSQRRRYHPIGMATDCQWNSKDLTSAVEYVGDVITRCNIDNYNHIQDMIALLVYGGHVRHHQDQLLIQSLVRSVIIPAKQLKQQAVPSTGTQHLLHKLVDSTRPRSSQLKQYQSIFDNMKDEILPSSLGLSPVATNKHNIKLSKLVCKDLVKIHSEPHDSLKTSYVGIIVHLQNIKHFIQELQKLSYTPGDGLNYLDNFLASETLVYQSHLSNVVSDIDVLVDGINGEVALTPAMLLDVQMVTAGYVPSSWMVCKESPQVIEHWRRCIDTKQRLLTEYCSGENLCVFELSAFSNPKMFLQSIAQEYARKEYIEVNRVQLQTQVLGMITPPTVQPEKGVYLIGLQLNNASWDSKRACLNISATNDQQNVTSSLPVIWLKPIDRAIQWEKSAIEGNVFKCPVHSSAVEDVVDAEDALFHVNLPSDLNDDVYNQLRVHAVIYP